ncbi:MAG: hypothetical protein HY047_01160 [Acidobacteria bacterium]|nr:hypothetical protein [Acidobacteriota bacterium]
MSRRFDLDIPSEHTRDRGDGSDRDLPRGGRGAAKNRPRERAVLDLQDVLVQQLDLPRTQTREHVWVGERTYKLRESEIRTLAVAGAFRVVDSRDLKEGSRDCGHGDLAHLREQKLIQPVGPLFRDGERAVGITLTKEGRALLEHYQSVRDGQPRQAFYDGVGKPREILHDAQLYRAYEDAAKRLQESGARIQRVVLDSELKREYQRFLQANNRGNPHSSGRPDRSVEEIAEWASAHGLSSDRGHVQFPDVRIEYERPDGSQAHEDMELVTEHYNSLQMAGKRASGFKMSRGASSHGRGSPFDPREAENVLR